VMFGRINCDVENALAGRFHVSKYPTLKLFMFGKLMRREYRGQRSVEALAEYVRSYLDSPITELSSPEDILSTDMRKRSIIGYYESAESPDYQLFKQIASVMKNDCSFYTSFYVPVEGTAFEGNKVMFRAPEDQSELVYPGSTAEYDMLHQWCDEKCFPAVRELTFENAEELTEEGLPFFILFHNPDDRNTPERYRNIVAAELSSEKRSVNFLVANGLKFSHPLHHLGKSSNDLPLVAIDSFRHMYLWQRDARVDIDKPGLLKQFIADLHSGKLHREFHQGPDPTQPPAVVVVESTELSDKAAPDSGHEASPDKGPEAAEENSPTNAGHVPKEADPDDTTEQETTKHEQLRTSPPESIFRKLAPSRNRYTILRDEL
jgi:endoplasmic reticulum resident protein 44